MYIKTINTKGKKKYKYYYHNVKINGRVKNIFLGSSKRKALYKLKKLKSNKIRYLKSSKINKIRYNFNNDFNELLRNAPAPHSILNYNINKNHIQSGSANPNPLNISNSSKVFLLLLALFLGIGLFYYSGDNSITGLVIYSQDKITLDVNNIVSKDAMLFVNAGSQEFSKAISKFNLNLVNETYQVNTLEVDITSLNFTLDPGTYTFVVSLIDNSILIAITSKDITISLEQPIIQPINESVITEPISE
ncbi:MAG: hypothetical protein AABW45_01575, partial [Nanoarchaeota archaeon]